MKGLECGQHMGVQDMSPTCMLAKSLLLFPNGKLADKLRVEKGVRVPRTGDTERHGLAGAWYVE